MNSNLDRFRFRVHHRRLINVCGLYKLNVVWSPLIKPYGYPAASSRVLEVEGREIDFISTRAQIRVVSDRYLGVRFKPLRRLGDVCLTVGDVRLRTTTYARTEHRIIIFTRLRRWRLVAKHTAVTVDLPGTLDVEFSEMDVCKFCDRVVRRGTVVIDDAISGEAIERRPPLGFSNGWVVG